MAECSLWAPYARLQSCFHFLMESQEGVGPASAWEGGEIPQRGTMAEKIFSSSSPKSTNQNSLTDRVN